MVSARPATTGERCRTPWTYIGRNVVAPIRIMPDKTVDALHAAIGRRFQSANEIMGSIARFSCIRKNSTHTIKNPPANNAFVTSFLPALVSDILSVAIDTIKRADPPRSSVGGGGRLDYLRKS